ncbi:hypothetical protein CHS0354_027387 [Potamilus streckersoni]|uniref:Carboxylase conserved domain-containing protein n=1 Tax=Potamilus streckersoni TaxID=2493646 RepID=A0AAE0W0M3_9BIVA|nr:hypothetical protein CHS0354_027387 [Potamilus streckersoni]
MPGGQYTNLKSQAVSLELGDRFEEVKQNYSVANAMLGNIVKVTPSSKVVGDLALYMTTHHLTEQDIRERGHTMNFPDSLKELLRGELGRPNEGFPDWIIKAVLKDESGFTEFQKKFPERAEYTAYLSWLMYPKVFEAFYAHYTEYGQVHYIPTRTFLYGVRPGEEVMVRISRAEGHDEQGNKTLSFDLNGQYRRVKVKDKNVQKQIKTNPKAEAPNHIGSPLMGKLSGLLVKKVMRYT